ncbi:hypothetical protein KI688_000970 [Linnemannia hyalina]|uniref:Uncharacterized protein n=1 Tax=Linnemannia hyalina TaxID=64524 RepID=A0A9P7Y6X5_9FUNG|nr:hypothetical protein KI688_000970 [Linnemannia hyalina]
MAIRQHEILERQRQPENIQSDFAVLGDPESAAAAGCGIWEDPAGQGLSGIPKSTDWTFSTQDLLPVMVARLQDTPNVVTRLEIYHKDRAPT